jgi:hypothetical protein
VLQVHACILFILMKRLMSVVLFLVDSSLIKMSLFKNQVAVRLGFVENLNLDKRLFAELPP